MDYHGNTQSFNINSFNHLNILQAAVPDDKAQVLQWLSSLEPHRRLQDLRVSRIEGVGQWIFRANEFRRWDTGEDGSAHSVLFCSGDPGVGKSYLSSLVIDHFYGSGQDITVTGLYCDYLDRKEQTTSNMLGAILKQLVGGGNIPEDIRKTFKEAQRHFGGVSPRIREHLKMSKEAIGQRQRVVICIDELDELLTAHRTGLLSSLQAIVHESPNVRLFLTGRPFIRSEVERYFPGVDTISVCPTNEDIKTFLEVKLGEDEEPDAMDERLRADIMETIPKRVSEIFLLVSLGIEAILAETTIHRREEKLRQISTGQDIRSLYTATLTRIREQKPDRSRLGMEAIMWVARSERPLRPEELCQALGVEIGSQDLNSRNVPSIRTVLSCGLGLVTVDSSSSTVRLVHRTLKEYILASPTLFPSPHSTIAVVCLTYLNFSCIRDLSPALSSPPPTTPFLEYASCYWGAHARRETSENVILLALNLLDQFDTHISCKLLLLKEDEWLRPFDIEDKPTGFTGLHGLVILGVMEIMISLFAIKRWDLNATDFRGNTALVWAARKGHDGIVRILLEREEVNPDVVGGDGRTPLSWAAAYGHRRIVKMLLMRSGVTADKVDWCGRTPFLWASMAGDEEIVKMLLERNDVNPDEPDQDGQTPLSWAAVMGNVGTVKMLLERSDVDPDKPDRGGQTPLSWAAVNGNEGTVKALLERNDVNPNTPDASRRTPLSWAATNGHAGVAAMLLRWGLNPDTADGCGRTPLSWAAENWNVEVVKMLLERADIDPNMQDGMGRTPLSWGCTGWAEVPDDVDPDTEGNSDRTQYLWATENRCGRVAKMLLERNDVDPDLADKSGRTPFSWAASHGHEEIVKILLERNDVDPDTPDERGRTPFLWAAMYEHEKIVKMLLERNDVTPDTPDESGRTPFSWAVEDGDEEIVKMLLKQNDANPERVDKTGEAPFSFSAMSGHEETVDILLGRSDTSSSTIGGNSGTPYSREAMDRQEGIPQMPLTWNYADPDTADEGGRIPLLRGSENGRAGAEGLLEGRHDLTTKSPLGEGSFGLFPTGPSELLQPPLKRIRRF